MRARLLCALSAVLLASLLGTIASAGGATDASSSVREAAASWAISEAGTREDGTTNCSPKIDEWQRDMGLKVPPCRVWCGAFVHQAFLRAGVKLSSRLIDPDRSYRDALAGRRGLRTIAVKDIQRGDLVFYKFRAGLQASHLAIARGRPRDGKLDTVEGNTSHAVRLERRGLKYIVLAARVTVTG